MIYKAQMTPHLLRAPSDSGGPARKGPGVASPAKQLARQILPILDRVTVQTGLSVTLDLSGRCQAPVLVERAIRPYRWQGMKLTPVVPGDPYAPPPAFVDSEVRCRKCDACLAQRAREWTARAMLEVAAAPRTWFGTLTLNPTEQFKALTRARLQARDSVAGDYDAMSLGEQFVRRVDALGVDLQRYIKRVRKQSGAPLRYLLVAERHQSGDPHFHMLVHECSLEHPVTKRVLDGQWIMGFSQWRLAEPGAARYVCKYLAKTLAARVRASQGYGSAQREQRSQTLASETMREINDPPVNKIEGA